MINSFKYSATLRFYDLDFGVRRKQILKKKNKNNFNNGTNSMLVRIKYHSKDAMSNYQYCPTSEKIAST